ncbi:patatin-like phospholipase family protein [Candidatus Woesearchaeota archaeon]|nr:patatin-like phospholipase family protein [Candidatus Woesearchaeota archaeon]
MLYISGDAGNGHTISKRTSAISLSGAGRKGSAHIGVMKRLDEEVRKKGVIESIDLIVGVSSGAMVAAGWSALEIDYLEHPERFQSYSGPAYKLEHILREDPNFYKLIRAINFFSYSGFVDKAPLKNFFRRLVDERTFRDAPKLRVVVHNLTMGKDVVFGEVGKGTKIVDALDATVAVAGLIEEEGWKYPPIHDAYGNILVKEGDTLIDGGTLRKSALRYITATDYDMLIDVYLGRQEYPISIGKREPPESIPHLLLQLLTHPLVLKSKVGKKIMRDVEIFSSAAATRDWFDYSEDVLANIGMPVEDVIRGKMPGVMVIAPYMEHTSMAESGVPVKLVDFGYKAADAAIRDYSLQRKLELVPAKEPVPKNNHKSGIISILRGMKDAHRSHSNPSTQRL